MASSCRPRSNSGRQAVNNLLNADVIRLRVERVALGSRKTAYAKPDCQTIEFSLEGVVGDKHAGFTRKADGRDAGVRNGTIIRNWRQWSAVSVEELRSIAQNLGLAELDASLLAPNIVFSGIDALTAIPKGSAIWFASGAVLTVEGENAPCTLAGKQISKAFPQLLPSEFPKAARGLRGLVGVVYKSGVVQVGDEAVVRIYTPPAALPKPP